MKTTTSNLIRWSGLAAVAAGSLFIAIQATHPLDLLEKVNSLQWTIVHIMGVAMCFFGLLGVTGIYAKQAEKAGWLGLIGYLLLTLFYALTMAFQFIEAFVSPVLVSQAPNFVEGFLGIASGQDSTGNVGALPTVYLLTGFAGYMLGGLLFAIATLRAGLLPRWAAILLAVGVVLPLVASGLVPHPFDRIFAVPVGAAIAWLGYALWSGRGEKSVEGASVGANLQLGQSGAGR